MKSSTKILLSSVAAILMSACGAESSAEKLSHQEAALKCNVYTSSTCFGIDWSSASPSQVEQVNPRTKDMSGRTALHWAAARSNNVKVIQMLLKSGANVNAQDGMGYTPLHTAVEGSKSDKKILQTLLKAGAKINATGMGDDTPLHMAAAKNEPWVLKLLLQAGANPNAGDFDNMTPLHTAAFGNSDIEVLKVLIAAGSDVNASGKTAKRAQQAAYTPLHAAAKGSRTPEVIFTLVNAGANVEARNRDGYTPLHVAADANRTPEVINAFVKAGAKVNVLNKDGYSPLHLAAYTNYPEMLEALIHAGAKVNAISDDGLTPLHFAAMGNGDPAVLTTLITSGADTEIKDGSGASAFDYAQQNEELKGTDGDGYRMLENAQ